MSAKRGKNPMASSMPHTFQYYCTFNLNPQQKKTKTFWWLHYLWFWLSWSRSMDGDDPERAKWVPFDPFPNDEATVTTELLVAAPLPPAAFVVAVVTSTGFLERFRPRCTWRSQYFWPATTSLEHRHFLPSVLRHLVGSGSMDPLPQYPDCNTTTKNTTCFKLKTQSKYHLQSQVLNPFPNLQTCLRGSFMKMRIQIQCVKN